MPTTRRFISKVLMGTEAFILSMWHNCSQRLMNLLGFRARQRVNRIIAINPEPLMRHTDPRAAYAARTTQIHANGCSNWPTTTSDLELPMVKNLINAQ